jgi:hypothetical protein
MRRRTLHLLHWDVMQRLIDPFDGLAALGVSEQPIWVRW